MNGRLIMEKPSTHDSMSIVIPVHNEADIIERVIADIHENVIKRMPDAKLIVVEDGSTDGTKEKLRELCGRFPFALVSAEERKGYTRAFRDAISIPQTDLIFFSDSDGQHSASDVFDLLKEADRNDIVSGYRIRRQDPLHRLIMTRVYNFLFNFLFGIRLHDINSGFKVIRRKVISDVLAEGLDFKYCVMSEFVIKAYLKGYKITEVPVSHLPREHGTTVIFSPMKLPFIVLGLIKDLLILKFKYLGRKKNGYSRS
jgi:glycosyltransferase involved in cell wall biosynthesis